MKLFKENKSLCALLIIFIIYIGITFLFINPLRIKNNDLENQKFEIQTLKNQENNIKKISKNKNQKEDIVLLIEKNIGTLVNINSINKQCQQINENTNEIILEVQFSSNLNNFFKLDTKLKELKLENSIQTINIERNLNEKQKHKNLDCTIIFKVV